MKFHGLFIGIDRYSSPFINWLSCARRDAIALHALFSDNFGGNTRLLLDEHATREEIEAAFEGLSQCSPNDIVVIAFSGHGSSTHELVTYDADVDRLADTAIPLEQLGDWFAKIPARQVICLLDCCFSGGAGAKVLYAPITPRNLASETTLLEQISGDGRLIFTASSATQAALESHRYRHGLMTYHLIHALQGIGEVIQAGRVSIHRLLEYVVQRVIDDARMFGREQQPSLRGKIDGELTWPALRPGDLYHTAFPERRTAIASADVKSLAAFGFPPELIDAWAGAIPALNELQQSAINEYGLLEGKNLLVSAPTSSGKTMVGELAALKGAIERKRAFFLLPLKSLVNDKHKYFTKVYGPFGLRTIRATGEIADDIPELMRGRFDICLMTYEKFAALILANPHLLEQVGTIVVDEVQMVTDPNRGANLEFILTFLRVKQQQGVEPQIIALSAVIGDTNGFERWIGARLLRRHQRPVPLKEGIMRTDGSFRYIDEKGDENTTKPLFRPQQGKGSSQDWIIPLVQRLVAEGKQVIVFRALRGEARGCANYLAKNLGLPPVQAALNALPSGDVSNASQTLHDTLAGGVAFHISDLDRDERWIIEEQFRAPNSMLRVIAATTTLAMGVNTPASAVVIAGLEHPIEGGTTPYLVAEYKNMVGRAGRLGFTEAGESYVIVTSAQEEHHVWDRYVKGTPEDLHSHFVNLDTDPRSLIIRVLAAAESWAKQGLFEEEIIGFLSESFGAFVQRLRQPSWAWNAEIVRQALHEIALHKLLQRRDDGRYEITELGRLAGTSGTEVESMIRLVEVLGSMAPQELDDQTLVAATQVTVELDDVLFPMNKKSKHKEPQQWSGELRRQGVANNVIAWLERWTRADFVKVMRWKRAVACLCWMSDLPLVDIERHLTQFGGAFDGAAGAIRSTAARTRDLFPVTVRVAQLLHPSLDLQMREQRLLARLEAGISATMVEVAMVLGTELSRGDYQRLEARGMNTVDALDTAKETDLLLVLGGDRQKMSSVKHAVARYKTEQQRAVKPTVAIPVFTS